MKILVLALGFGLVTLAPQTAAAATPPPGGANQSDAVEGGVKQTLFNGEVRMRIVALRIGTDAERDAVSPPEEQKVIVLTCTLNNGTHESFNGVFDYALADADGVVVDAESRYVVPNPPPGAPPAGGWRETVSFIVPKDYAPRKLVVTQTAKTNTNDLAKAFRWTIDPATIR